MSKLFDCDQCGGAVEVMSGANRTHEYLSGVTLPVPADFAIPTCRECGETYLTTDEAEALERTLEVAFTEYCRNLVDTIRSRAGVTLKEVERAAGVTATYLSHVLSGRKRLSLSKVRLLQAFAIHPSEVRRHLEGRGWQHAARAVPTFMCNELVMSPYRTNQPAVVRQRYRREENDAFVESPPEAAGAAA
jgi:transcriptional regulator with XRE-family HTH domain